MEAVKKILVVDDEPDIIMYLSTLLEDHGYEVLTASSAEQAREILAEGAPDLLCLDIMMPKQSGIAFYKELRLDDRFKDTPTMFISAFSLARDFSGQGFRKLIPDSRIPEPEAFIEKPVRPGVLIETVGKILG